MAKKTKIVLVVHTAYPNSIGGREKHVHNFATCLSRSDRVEVVVVAGGKVNKEACSFINGYKLILLPMLSIKVSRNPLQIYRIIPRLYAVLKREEADICHAFEYGSFTTDITALYAKRMKKLFYLTVYGYQFRSQALKLCKCFYDLMVGRSLLNYAVNVFCCSQAQKDELRKLVKNHQKIIIQPNCILIDENDPVFEKVENIRQTYNLENKMVILSIVRILPRKGLCYLIEAVRIVVYEKKFLNCLLLIVGPDCGERQRLVSLVKKYKLEQNVRFVGTVPYEEVKNYIEACDIFVLPSLYEGLPLALLEAMLMKKAVIFSRISCAEQVVRDDYNGYLVEPRDSIGLANKLLDLFRDESKRHVFGLRASETAKTFDVRIEVEKMLGHYN
jgi:glycosyltransferase involved in cell wall biosynthesis